MQPTICLFVMLVMAGLSLAKIPGGSTNANNNDAVIKRMAEKAVFQMGSGYALNTIPRAMTRVVMGLMYHLNLDVNTRISPTIEKFWSCKAKIHEVSWLNTLELVEFHCRKRG